MCSIAGLFDKNGSNVSVTLLDMLKQTSHRGPDGCGIYVQGVLEKSNDVQDLKIDNIQGDSGLGHSRLQITGSAGVQPLVDCYKRFVLGFNGEIWNYKELRTELVAKGHVFETDSDSEVVIHLVEENYKKCANLSTSVLYATQKLDGEFAFVVFDNATKRMVLTRDSVGVKPLYYGHNKKYVSFCSEKKPLWKIGIRPKRVLPGEVIELFFYANSANRPIFEIQGNNELIKPLTKSSDLEISLMKYKQALFNAVKKRVDGKNKIGIIFSGGIDSVLIARVAQLLSCDITCYASGFRGSPDVTASINAAEKLGLDLKIHELTENELKSNLEDIMSSIESSNHLQIDVAIPIFFAVQDAKKDGIRVMLTGQGADELFAGYSWYPEILKKEGAETLNQSLWNDIENLYKDTLEREDKITMYHSIELRVPYLDPEVIDVAMSISEELKIRDNHVKYIHRKLAQDLGVPIDLAWRKKEAAQHGSNVHNKLLSVLENMEETTPYKISTLCNATENLGSAYRYNHSTYEKNERVQNFLNGMGEKLGLYPETSYAIS